MPDNEIDTLTDTEVDASDGEVNEPEIIPDPEPNPTIWAVTETSYRAVLSTNDLQPGEKLVVGDRPVIQDQRADAVQMKSQLLALAAEQIAPLQDAVDLDMAAATESAALLAWKKYRVLVNRVDVMLAPDIDWPEQPGPVT